MSRRVADRPPPTAEPAASGDGRRVRDVMREVPDVVHVDHPMDEVRTRMAAADAVALPVVDGDEIVGSIDPAAAGRTDLPQRAKARDAMRADVLYCCDDEPVATAAALMARTGAPAIWVVGRGGELLGQVLADDLDPGGRAAPMGRESVRRHRHRSAGRTIAGQGGRPATYRVRPRLRD